jgi:hypothetical protein
MNDTVGEFNGAARLLPREDESPRYFTMSLQDNCLQFQHIVAAPPRSLAETMIKALLVKSLRQAKRRPLYGVA